MKAKYSQQFFVSTIILSICLFFLTSIFSFQIAEAFDWKAFVILLLYSFTLSFLENPIVKYFVENNKYVKDLRLTLYEQLNKIDVENKWDELKTFSLNDSKGYSFRRCYNWYKIGFKKETNKKLTKDEFRTLFKENKIEEYIHSEIELRKRCKKKILKIYSQKSEVYPYSYFLEKYKNNKILVDPEDAIKAGINLFLTILSIVLGLIALFNIGVFNLERAFTGFVIISIVDFGSFYFKFKDELNFNIDCLKNKIDTIHYFNGEKIENFDVYMFYSLNKEEYDSMSK